MDDLQFSSMKQWAYACGLFLEHSTTFSPGFPCWLANTPLFYHSRPSRDFWYHMTVLLWEQWLCVFLREQRVISMGGFQSRPGPLLVNGCGLLNIIGKIPSILCKSSFQQILLSIRGITTLGPKNEVCRVGKAHQSKTGSRILNPGFCLWNPKSQLFREISDPAVIFFFKSWYPYD